MNDEDDNFFSLKGGKKGKSEWLPKEFTRRTVTQAVKKNIYSHLPVFNKVCMVDGVPLFSQVELNVNELCNRTCIFCPRSGDYPNQNLHMDLKLVQSIATQLKDLSFSGIVNICGTGEPLLTKYLEDIVNEFGSRNIKIEIVTNGDKLNLKKIKSLYDAGLSKFVVSMYDGPHQIEHFNNLFAECGIDENFYILRDRWYDEDKDYGVIYTNRTGAMGDAESSPSARPCYYPSYALYIDWNGDVLLCCQDSYNRTIIIGNIEKRTLLDIWKDETFLKFRKPLKEGNRCKAPCSNCSANGMVYGRHHAEVW